MVIGIDIDDTLTNTKELQKEFWKEYHKQNPNSEYTDEIPSNINHFGYEYIEKFWDLYREKLFYPKFKENVSEVLIKLKEDGHELCVITSRPDYKYKDLHKRLETWFKENNIPINTIFTAIKNKGHYCKKKNIDLLIDNEMEQIEEANKYNIKNIMFGNNSSYNGLKASNWQEIYDIIKGL